MGEALRQGLFVFVGGLIFCIACAMLALLVSGVIRTDRNVNYGHEVVYDASEAYRIY